MPQIKTKHVSELPKKEDGFRVLVTRKWPRGIPRESVDLWLKELGGSPDLLKEYKKGKISDAGFQARYFGEISEPARRELVDELQRRAMNGKPLIILCDSEGDGPTVRDLLKEKLEAY